MSGTAALLERDGELETLGSAFATARKGASQTMLIEATAGTGKSVLLAEASARASEAGLQVLAARGSELEQQFAFGVARQLFEPVLAAASPAQRRRLLANGAAPAAAAIESSTGARATGLAVLHALHLLTVAVAAEQPLLIAVDDLHWADASSLRALSYIAGRMGDSQQVMVLALRPDEPGAPAALLDALTSHPGARRLSLAPLSGDAVASLVRAHLPGADDETCEAARQVTVGNPFYVRELIRSVPSDGDTSAESIRRAALPSLGDRVARRIAPVADRAPALAVAMAVMGDGGSLAVAAAMADLAEVEAGRIAHGLRRIEVLSEEDPFAFVHPLVRRSVYDTLPIPERNSLHTAAAALLAEAGAPVEKVASQLSAVAPSGSSSVAAVLVEAAEEALARGAPDEAIRWFGRALEEAAPEPHPAAILAQLGMTRSALRDKQAIADLQRALELAEDPGLRVRVALALGEILMQAGYWDHGMEVVASARAELGDAHPELKAELDAEIAAVRSVVMANDPAMINEFDRDRERFTALAGGDSWAAHALAAVLALVASHRGEGTEKVLALAERALEGGRLLSERGSGGWASAQVLSALAAADENERALAACEEVSAAARRDGSLIGAVTGLLGRGWIHSRQGDLITAEAELRSALDMARQAEIPMIDVSAVFSLQDVILERPSLDDVAELVETIELDPGFATTWTGGMLLLARGRLRVVRRDRKRGVEDLRRGVAIQRALHLGPTLTPSRSILALALPAACRDEAAALVDEELTLARTSGLARPLGMALRAAGVLEGGDTGIERLRESASLLAGSGARLEHARSLVELGAALRRSRHRSEARTELAMGMELADRCGARRLVTRAHEELAAAGGRPRRIATTGPAALTASERRVADLAAHGATNADIAQDLVVSLKTVETHLSHAYAKLGLAGRGARVLLADRLGAK